MTSIALLVTAILTSMLLALLDMLVFRESYMSALMRQSLSDNIQSYIILSAALLLAVLQDVRSKRPKSKGQRETPHG